MAVPDSLYRAWKLEHEPPEPKDGTGFDWLEWSQDSTLRLATVNQLKAITVLLARLLGDKRMKPDLLEPPGVRERKPERQSLDMAASTAASMRAFLMGV